MSIGEGKRNKEDSVSAEWEVPWQRAGMVADQLGTAG